jgi:hypothetical protein
LFPVMLFLFPTICSFVMKDLFQLFQEIIFTTFLFPNVFFYFVPFDLFFSSDTCYSWAR